jgi:hypothetical protein
MNTTQMLQNVMAKKGQFGRAKINKPLQTRKGVMADIRKVSNIVIRAGINYDNLSAVKEKRQTGELPETNAGLPWGEYVNGCFPYLIHHKGQHYVRLYPSGKPDIQYLMNGKLVSESEIKNLVLASEIRENTADCITVKLDNLEELV